jgi:hypothetical protein
VEWAGWQFLGEASGVCVQKKLEEAQAFMETVTSSKLGQDWREKQGASDPGQLGRYVGEGMMIGDFPCPADLTPDMIAQQISPQAVHPRTHPLLRQLQATFC